jgi:hypothetical protein
VLTEQRFFDLYRLAQELQATGAEAAARELYFHLFDRGADAGGYGVVRLTFVLRELGEMAQPTLGGEGGEGGEGGVEARRALDGLVARRDEREEAAERGEAGFRSLQEMVALNRALGDSERSYRLYRGLHERSARGGGGGGGEGPELSGIVHVLGELVREELVPRDPQRLAREIFHQRLRARVAEAAAVAALLLEGRAAGGGESGTRGDADTDHHRHLLNLGTEARRLCGDLLEEARREPEEVPREVVDLAREAERVLEAQRLRAALVRDAAGRQALAALRSEADALVERHGLDPASPAAERLHARVVELAGDVARTIGEERVREDFARRRAAGEADAELTRWTETKVRGDGLLVYEVLLRIGEVDTAESLSAWLLAYRQDEEMYLKLIDAARRTGHEEVVDRLNEEAQRALVGT